MANTEKLQQISTQVRRDIIRMVTNAKSGHPGGSMSSADFLTALYFEVMNHNPETWTRSGKGQDMFILSAGHLTPVFYSLLSRSGYFPTSELATFRLYGTRLQGHPCVETGLPGVFQASGSLGQGLSAAIGLAIGKKMDKEAEKVYVMMGLNELGWAYERVFIQKFGELIDRIRSAAGAVGAVDVVGDPLDRLPHVCTFSVLYVDGETLADELARRGLAVASGSACTSDTMEPSHVLAAMGALTQGNVRLTLPLAAVSPGRADDVDHLCEQLPHVVHACRERRGTVGL